jgi:hypothetical protein
VRPSLATLALALLFDVSPSPQPWPRLPAPVPPDPGDRAWRVLRTVDGVKLAQADSDRPGTPWGLGEGEIAAPLAVVAAHLTDVGALSRFLPRVEAVQVLRRDADEAVVYFRFDLPWPISDRDWTVRYRFGLDAAGRFRMQWSDVNELGPPPHRTVRVSPVRGAWELSATAHGTTWARYVFLAELGGHPPRGVIEQTVWKQPLETIQGIRRALSAKSTASP